MMRFLGTSRRGQDGGRRSLLRDSSGRALKKLDLDAAFFWLILVFLLTVLAFFSLRPKHIALNAAQIAEYERRTQFLSNSTVYIIEVGRPENLLSKISPANWKQVSVGIDFVAFVFDDLQLFLTENWVGLAEAALRDRAKAQFNRAMAGVGIALFPCGCVIPNEYFVRVKERLEGLECTLLPGWVLDNEDVHWLDVNDPSTKRCKRRSQVLESRVARRHAASLQAIRKSVAEILQEVANATAVSIDAKALAPNNVQQKVAASAKR